MSSLLPVHYLLCASLFPLCGYGKSLRRKVGTDGRKEGIELKGEECDEWY